MAPQLQPDECEHACVCLRIESKLPLPKKHFDYTFPDTSCGSRITGGFILVGSSKLKHTKQVYQETDFL